MIQQKIQQALEARYDLTIEYQVDHFISHDEDLVRALTGGPHTAPEMLLIYEEPDNLDVTLFLEQGLLESVEHASSAHHSSDNFNNYCILLEGISHFVYLVWNAQYGRQIKPIEMELQAEVDKFVLAAQIAEAQASCDNSPNTMHQRLSASLFENVSFSHPQGSDILHRYRTANRFAKHYCQWLAMQYRFSDDDPLLYAELARFYRMNAAAKFNHIKQSRLSVSS